MNIPRDKQIEGGHIASQKVYYCPTCHGIGGHNRFVSEHLTKECSGVQKRKTIASTKKNAHRLQEAQMNTREWQAHQVKKEANAILNQFKLDVIRDIENLREINREVMEEMLQTYYREIF